MDFICMVIGVLKLAQITIMETQIIISVLKTANLFMLMMYQNNVLKFVLMAILLVIIHISVKTNAIMDNINFKKFVIQHVIQGILLII